MTRVIHTGDTHLGYQQYHVPERREDFLAAFRQVAEDAVADDVDAVVHAGDLFHDRRPTLPDILGALSVLRTLDDADVPFLAVVGNHETKRDAQWLDLFESLGLATRLGDEPEVIGDTAFYGLDFVPRASRDDLLLEFASHDVDHAALVTHGLFEPFDLGEWDVRDLLRDANRGFDAVLLGDNHDPGTKQIEEPSDTWVTYCGSTERASADEREERGYNLVHFEGGGDDGGEVDIRRRGLETRAFVYVDVELGPGEGMDRVRERVGQHDLDEAVVHVRVEGDGEPITPAAVEEFAHDGGALVARVTDHRELADEAEVDVSFADPDEAVRERVRELGLSEAARELDEIVRASKVADSNVDDTVEDQVRALIEEADSDAFQTVPPGDDSTSGDVETQDVEGPETVTPEAEGPEGGEPEAEGPEAEGPEGGEPEAGTPNTGTGDTEAPDPDSPGGDADDAETEGGRRADDGAQATTDAPDEGTSASDSHEGTEPASGDERGDPEDQATMEEYL